MVPPDVTVSSGIPGDTATTGMDPGMMPGGMPGDMSGMPGGMPGDMSGMFGGMPGDMSGMFGNMSGMTMPDGSSMSSMMGTMPDGNFSFVVPGVSGGAGPAIGDGGVLGGAGGMMPPVGTMPGGSGMMPGGTGNMMMGDMSGSPFAGMFEMPQGFTFGEPPPMVNVPMGGGAPGIPPGRVGWEENADGTWNPPADFNPPPWWDAPAGYTGGALPEGDTPWSQLQDIMTGLGLLPGDMGTMPGGMGGGMPGGMPPGIPGPMTEPPAGTGWQETTGGWMPPENFDSPEWWTPPEGWEFGEPLPDGAAPWQQIGTMAPVGNSPFGGIPQFPAGEGPDGPPPPVDVPTGGPGAGNGPPEIPPAQCTWAHSFSTPRVLTDAEGNPFTDTAGNPLQGILVMDEEGNLIYGPFGYPIVVLEE